MKKICAYCGKKVDIDEIHKVSEALIEIQSKEILNDLYTKLTRHHDHKHHFKKFRNDYGYIWNMCHDCFRKANKDRHKKMIAQTNKIFDEIQTLLDISGTTYMDSIMNMLYLANEEDMEKISHHSLSEYIFP